MKQVTDSEYREFIEKHLGHINITGTFGAIQWIHTDVKDFVMACKRDLGNQIIYEVSMYD